MSMGVYIKGMELPCACVFCELYEADLYWCRGAKKEVPYSPEDKRAKFCPLVPVPPHGDLIERKTAYDSLLDGMVMTGYQSRALDCIAEYRVPTIIPASEEGET